MLERLFGWVRTACKGREVGEDLEQQIEAAEYLRDMLGVARKLDFDVILTVEVNGLRQGVLLSGRGPECEWIYQFAAAEVYSKISRRAEGVNKDDKRTGSGWGRWRKRGPR